ncbi:MAG: hypothetical protein AB1813_24835 [Verrucomicrobiota bacterium]
MRRFEGKPFVLLGVNSDPKHRLKSAIERERLNWRSWWDGGSTAGPISRRWNVKGWPTLHLVDHKGIMRHKDILADELEPAIEALLKEIKTP